MKDKIVTTDSMKDIYVVEELDYMNKKYILCHNPEEKNESLIELDLFEVILQDNELHLNNVEEEIAQIVTNMMMEKIKNDDE